MKLITILILSIVYCLHSERISDVEIIAKKSMELPALRLIKENNKEIINYSEEGDDHRILYNGIISDTLSFFYFNTPVEFYKYGPSTNGKFINYGYSFNRLEIKKKKAFVSLNYYPTWKNVSGSSLKLKWSSDLYIRVNIEFEKKGNEWKVVNYCFKDIVFDAGRENHELIKQKYLGIEKECEENRQ